MTPGTYDVSSSVGAVYDRPCFGAAMIGKTRGSYAVSSSVGAVYDRPKVRS